MGKKKKSLCKTLYYLQLVYVIFILPIQLPFTLPNDGVWYSYGRVLFETLILIQGYFCLSKVQSNYAYMLLSGLLLSSGSLGLFSLPDTTTTLYSFPDNLTGWDRKVVNYIGCLLWMISGLMYCLHGQKNAIIQFQKYYVNSYVLLTLFELVFGPRPFPSSFNEIAPPLQDLGAFSYMMLLVWIFLMLHLGFRKEQRVMTFKWLVDGVKLIFGPFYIPALTTSSSSSSNSMRKLKK